MPNYNEFEGLTGTEFFPYDDSQEERLYVVAAISEQSGSGYDTSPFDRFRQGVEITSARFLYESTQPKFWAGNLEHATRIETIGQARSWVEYTNVLAHDDLLSEFDATRYIEDPFGYPMPIYFNDGPQSDEEAIIEPLTIPFRKSPEEGAFPAHRPKGNLEDGNDFDTLPASNNRILQFIEYATPLTPRYFLDGGQEYIGAGDLDDSIIREGFVPMIVRLGKPFDDTQDEEIVKQVDVGTTGDSSTFLSNLKQLHMELDEDIRETYTQKSAPAGRDVYGPTQAIYGTDSFAYAGLVRGS